MVEKKPDRTNATAGEGLNIEVSVDNTSLPKRVKVSGLLLRSTIDGATDKIDVDGVFIAIGHAPASGLLDGKVELHPDGYVKVKPGTKSNPGIMLRAERQSRIPNCEFVSKVSSIGERSHPECRRSPDRHVRQGVSRAPGFLLSGPHHCLNCSWSIHCRNEVVWLVVPVITDDIAEPLLDAKPYCRMRKNVEIVIANGLHRYPGNVGGADIGCLHPRSDALIEWCAVWIC